MPEVSIDKAAGLSDEITFKVTEDQFAYIMNKYPVVQQKFVQFVQNGDMSETEFFLRFFKSQVFRRAQAVACVCSRAYRRRTHTCSHLAACVLVFVRAVCRNKGAHASASAADPAKATDPDTFWKVRRS